MGHYFHGNRADSGYRDQVLAYRQVRERIATIAVVLLSGVLSGWVGWMYLDNQPAYEYLAGEIQPNPAPQGGQVSLPWHIKVNRLCPGSVLRVLYDADSGAMVAAYDRTLSSTA